MEYFLEFHWWYLLAGAVFLFTVFGKSKGGVIAKRLTASMDVLDERFAGCRLEAKYSTFKKDSPDHLEIELENLSIPVGDELEFEINGETLAKVKVEKDHEAEFDYWSDEGVDFPVINEGDRLVIRYQRSEVIKGTFR